MVDIWGTTQNPQRRYTFQEFNIMFHADHLIIAITLYIAFIAFLNSPKKVATQPEEIKIDYFPEVEQETPEMPVIPCPWETEIEIVMIPEVKEPTIEIKAIAALPPAKETELETATDYSKLSVRCLYKVAKELGIKNVKKLNKRQLVELLS
jgi:hypothetical protein